MSRGPLNLTWSNVKSQIIPLLCQTPVIFLQHRDFCFRRSASDAPIHLVTQARNLAVIYSPLPLPGQPLPPCPVRSPFQCLWICPYLFSISFSPAWVQMSHLSRLSSDVTISPTDNLTGTGLSVHSAPAPPISSGFPTAKCTAEVILPSYFKPSQSISVYRVKFKLLSWVDSVFPHLALTAFLTYLSLCLTLYFETDHAPSCLHGVSSAWNSFPRSPIECQFIFWDQADSTLYWSNLSRPSWLFLGIITSFLFVHTHSILCILYSCL